MALTRSLSQRRTLAWQILFSLCSGAVSRIDLVVEIGQDRPRGINVLVYDRGGALDFLDHALGCIFVFHSAVRHPLFHLRQEQFVRRARSGFDYCQSMPSSGVPSCCKVLLRLRGALAE